VGPYDLTSSITVPGNGDGSSNGQVPFDPLRQNQRPGLVLVMVSSIERGLLMAIVIHITGG